MVTLDVTCNSFGLYRNNPNAIHEGSTHALLVYPCLVPFLPLQRFPFLHSHPLLLAKHFCTPFTSLRYSEN